MILYLKFASDVIEFLQNNNDFCYIFISNFTNYLFSCRKNTSVWHQKIRKCQFEVHEIKFQKKVLQEYKSFRDCEEKCYFLHCFSFFFYIFILPLVDLFGYFLFIINSIIKVKVLSFLSFTQSPYYLVHSNFIGKKTLNLCPNSKKTETSDFG